MSYRSPVVDFDRVSKVYDREGGGLRLRSALLLDERPRSPHLALDNLDLQVGAGESVGMIGPNGAGKSTLLKLVAGVTQPSSGVVRRHGRVGALIELTVGFHPELTGWENLRCSARLRGISHGALEPVLHEIAEFADIEDAMDAPLKKYSLGMRARLAFALATQFPVDILVVDEVLAVGDTDFQLQCMDRINAMVRAGTTLLFVSHEMRLISLMCDRAVRLEEGTVVDDGPATEVVARYLKQAAPSEVSSAEGAMTISSLDIAPEMTPWGRLEVDAVIDVARPVSRPAVTMTLTTPTLNPDLVHILASDRLPPMSEPGSYRLYGISKPFGMKNLDIELGLRLADGAIACGSARAPVRMVGDGAAWSYVAVEPRWTISPAVDEAGPAHRSVPGSRSLPDAVVSFRGVTKSYRSGRTRAAVRAALPGSLGRSIDRDLVALQDLDLEIGRGEAVGIIGPNGAGKSTLLRLAAGLTAPDSGRVVVSAPVIPMLDFGSGMHPQLTGRENARVRARLLGMTDAEAVEAEDAIEEFADIGEAINAPIFQYSTGMLVRLGFAVAIHSPGSVLLIDELLAVGDEGFRRAALAAVDTRRRHGDTVLFVSHEMVLIEQVCDRVVRLDSGRLVDDGPASEMIVSTHGSGAAVGVHDATSGIRMSDVRLRQRRILVGGSIDLEGVIEVDEPAPHARLELSYRAVPDDRALVVSREDRNVRSFFIDTVEHAGGALATKGRYRFRCVVPDHPITGNFDVVIAAIDDREGTVLAEQRQEVLIGHPNPSGVPIPATDFSWSVEAL